MAETIKDIIAKMQEQKNSQSTQTKPVEIPKVKQNPEIQIPPEFDKDDDEDLDAEEMSDADLLAKELTPEQKKMQLILREREILQNDGIYRQERLHQEEQKITTLKEIRDVIIGLASVWANK